MAYPTGLRARRDNLALNRMSSSRIQYHQINHPHSWPKTGHAWIMPWEPILPENATCLCLQYRHDNTGYIW